MMLSQVAFFQVMVTLLIGVRPPAVLIYVKLSSLRIDFDRRAAF
jgi:hypothetical protein